MTAVGFDVTGKVIRITFLAVYLASAASDDMTEPATPLDGGQSR